MTEFSPIGYEGNRQNEHPEPIDRELYVPPQQMTTEERIIHDRLKAAQPEFERIAEQLAEEYDHKQWNIVIGDDASGRLPALFVGQLLNKWRHDSGAEPAKRVFIGGGRVPGETFYHEQLAGRAHTTMQLPQEDFDRYAQQVAAKEEAVNRTIDTLLPDAGRLFDRALIVTEHIEFGHTLRRVAEALSERGVDFDIVAFNTSDSVDIIEDRLRDHGLGDAPMDIFVGKADTPVDITFKPQKDDAGKTFRSSFGVRRNEGEGTGVRPDPHADQSLMRVARQTISEIVEDCYNYYPVAIGEYPYDDDEYAYATQTPAPLPVSPSHHPDHPLRVVQHNDKW